MICSSAIPQPFAIRPAIIDDVPKLYAMIQKFAADLGAGGGLHSSEEDWRRNGFGPHAKFESLIAECDSAAVGFATYSSLYLPDLGEDSLAVHQIYVDAALRRRGIAKALLARIAATATANPAPANPDRHHAGTGPAALLRDDRLSDRRWLHDVFVIR